jgi:hypothetical protein
MIHGMALVEEVGPVLAQVENGGLLRVEAVAPVLEIVLLTLEETVVPILPSMDNRYIHTTPVEAEVQERDLGRQPENVEEAEMVTVETEVTVSLKVAESGLVLV